jgi:hypothetical protein
MLLAALAVGGVAVVHEGMPVRTRAAEGELFVPRPEVARATALGFDAVVADYYWLQAVQHVGNLARKSSDTALLGALIDVVTTLDPWVDHPYRFAAVWMIDSEPSIRHANRLLERGIAYHPHEWRNRFYLGFNHFFYFGEDAAAAEVLEGTIGLPGTPPYVSRLVARLRAAEGGLDVAEAFLHGLLLETEDPVVRDRYALGLDEIASERVARVLDEARARYRERNGRDIEAVEDLLRGPNPALDVLPADPAGGRWIVEQWTKEIVSDRIGHRYEPKIDAVNRAKVEKIRKGSGG